jgi:hypothetical protein
VVVGTLEHDAEHMVGEHTDEGRTAEERTVGHVVDMHAVEVHIAEEHNKVRTAGERTGEHIGGHSGERTSEVRTVVGLGVAHVAEQSWVGLVVRELLVARGPLVALGVGLPPEEVSEVEDEPRAERVGVLGCTERTGWWHHTSLDCWAFVDAAGGQCDCLPVAIGLVALLDGGKVFCHARCGGPSGLEALLWLRTAGQHHAWYNGHFVYY